MCISGDSQRLSLLLEISSECHGILISVYVTAVSDVGAAVRALQFHSDTFISPAREQAHED